MTHLTKAALAAATVSAALLTAGSAQAKLLITEAMPDPSGTDADREWFEIYNSGTTAINLTGYAVGDGLDSTNTSGGEGLGVFPSGTTINAGQVMIIAIRNGGFTSLFGTSHPGLNADFEFANSQGTSTTVADDPNVPNLVQKAGWGNSAGSLGMANGGDDVGIVDPDGNVVDMVSYGPNGMVTSWADAASATIQRIPADQDTDTGAEWSYVTGLANSTPGTVSVPEPAGACAVGLAALGMRRRRRRQAN
jgi:MYXO-CTERM domain-containing protein